MTNNNENLFVNVIVVQDSLAPIGGVVNEKWVLDAVVSLGGAPTVTDNGNIAYVFEVGLCVYFDVLGT